jgi:flagellar hook-associated protein 3 FlgL
MIDRIGSLNARQTRLQSQVATGQRIFQPSDDPAAMGRILTLSNEKAQLSQFDTNTSYALDVSKATYSSINAIKKISDRAGEIVTLGTGVFSSSSANTYADEVNQLIEQSLQLGNSRLRNDYLFSGTALDTAPYEVSSRNAAGEVTAIHYAGETDPAHVVQIPISENSSIAPGSEIATNQGVETFVNHLISLRDALRSGDTTALQTVRTQLESDEDSIVSSLSAHGAIQLRIEVSQAQRTERLDNIDRLVSGETDVDLPETITKLNQASLAYQAALQSASQIMQISLLDYLK